MSEVNVHDDNINNIIIIEDKDCCIYNNNAEAIIRKCLDQINLEDQGLTTKAEFSVRVHSIMDLEDNFLDDTIISSSVQILLLTHPLVKKLLNLVANKKQQSKSLNINQALSINKVMCICIGISLYDTILNCLRDAIPDFHQWFKLELRPASTPKNISFSFCYSFKTRIIQILNGRTTPGELLKPQMDLEGVRESPHDVDRYFEPKEEPCEILVEINDNATTDTSGTKHLDASADMEDSVLDKESNHIYQMFQQGLAQRPTGISIIEKAPKPTLQLPSDDRINDVQLRPPADQSPVSPEDFLTETNGYPNAKIRSRKGRNIYQYMHIEGNPNLQQVGKPEHIEKDDDPTPVYVNQAIIDACSPDSPHNFSKETLYKVLEIIKQDELECNGQEGKLHRTYTIPDIDQAGLNSTKVFFPSEGSTLLGAPAGDNPMIKTSKSYYTIMRQCEDLCIPSNGEGGNYSRFGEIDTTADSNLNLTSSTFIQKVDSLPYDQGGYLETNTTFNEKMNKVPEPLNTICTNEPDTSTFVDSIEEPSTDIKADCHVVIYEDVSGDIPSSTSKRGRVKSLKKGILKLLNFS